MLQADAAHVVGEREQEIVMIVVVRAVKFVGLLHQGAVRLELLRLHFQQIRRGRPRCPDEPGAGPPGSRSSRLK